MNASQTSRVGAGINRSAGERNVKHYDWFDGLDTALYKIIPLYLFYIYLQVNCIGSVFI